MSEVSGRATATLVDLIAYRGLPVDEVIAATGVPAETLRDPRAFVSLDACVALVEEAARRVGPGGADSLGADVHKVSWNLVLAGLGRFGWTERQLWRLMARRVAPHMFRTVELGFEPLSAGRFALSIDFPASHPGSLAFMELYTGIIRATPRLLGGDRDADVVCDLTPSHARYVVTPAPAGGRVRRLARSLMGRVLGEPAVAAIERQQRHLEGSYDQLRASQRRLRLITESAFDLIGEIDARGRFHWASPNFHAILGYEPDELVRRDAFELIHAEDRERIAARLAEVVEHGASARDRYRYRHADGRWLWLESTVRSFEDVAGEPRLIVLSRDVTESREAALELEERNRCLASLCAVTDALTESLGVDGTADRIVHVIAERTGFPSVTFYTLNPDGGSVELAADSLRPTPPGGFGERLEVADGLAGRALAERRVAWADAQGNGLPASVLERLQRLGMQPLAVVPLLFHGRVIGGLGLAAPDATAVRGWEDETLLALGKTAGAAFESARYLARIERESAEREQAQRALRESEERLREVAENVDGLFYLVEADTRRLLYLGPSFERLMGLDAQAVMERPELFYEIVHPDDRERLRDAFRNNRNGYEIEYRVLRADGSQRVLFDRATPVRSPNGTPRVAGFAQDVTELRELEFQLRHSQKMEALGRLAGGVAHDFNNLLTVISGYGEVLCERLDPESGDRSTAEEILRAAERATDLTRQLLGLARKQPVHRRSLDLNGLIRDLQPMLASLLGEDVALDVDLGPTPLCVLCDRGQLEQVLVNLALNARDAMPEGGQLSLVTERRAGPDAPRVRLSVRDTGVGMDAETRSRIFDPFFSTKEVGRGTGLGLANVYGIVQQAGGRITVESAPGKGACFAIDLPEVAAESSTRGAAASRSGPAGSETLLLVEDEAEVRQVARRMLEERGYRVVAVADAEAALREVAARPIDLMVTDVVMPGLRGTELAVRVEGLRPGLPVLFVSGYTDAAEEIPLDRPGVGFLAKPFTPRALACAVRDLLDRRAVPKAARPAPAPLAPAASRPG